MSFNCQFNIIPFFQFNSRRNENWIKDNKFTKTFFMSCAASKYYSRTVFDIDSELFEYIDS